jgi:hypothetical protein
MSEDKRPKITIAWGSDLELTRTYVFENETQKAFFMKGVDEANGWLEYAEVEQGHETISYEQTNDTIVNQNKIIAR